MKQVTLSKERRPKIRMLRVILAVVLRGFFYGWIGLCVLMRSDTLLTIVYENYWAFITLIVFLSIALVVGKQDETATRWLLKSRRVYILYLILAIYWLQLGVEWILGTKVDNYESFMLYEPMALISGAPASLVIFFAKNLFRIHDTQIYATVLWALYCTMFFVQFYFVIKIIRTKFDLNHVGIKGA